MATNVTQRGAAQQAWENVSDRQIFWSVMALAAVIRFIASLPVMFGHYDEIWQYMEPAWHLVEGPWVQTWDFRDGIRSWLLPYLISGPMALGLWLDPEGQMHMWLPRLAAAALSLTIVGAATSMGLRLSRLHGVMAGVVSAIWYELVFYGPRLQAETIGFSLIMGAAWLLFGRKAAPEFRHYFFASALLGLCVVIRFQYAPALLFMALCVVKLDFRGKWLPFVLGGLFGMSADALANWAGGSAPFMWVWNSYFVVLVDSIENGVAMPFLAYVGTMGFYWGLVLAPVFLMLARRGMKHYPILFWTAVFHFLMHSLLPHKEYRYVMGSLGILMILAALGMADVLRSVPREKLMRTAAATLGVWALASVTLATIFYDQHAGFLKDLAKAHDVAHDLHRHDRQCGFTIFAPHSSIAGSYALYRRDNPIYAFHDAETLTANKAAFNILVTQPQHVSQMPKEFKLQSCAKEEVSDAPTCIMVREGGCSGPVPEHYLNAYLKRTGQ